MGECNSLRAPLEVFSTLWSTVHLFLVLLFENNDVIGAPNIPGPANSLDSPVYSTANFDIIAVKN